MIKLQEIARYFHGFDSDTEIKVAGDYVTFIWITGNKITKCTFSHYVFDLNTVKIIKEILEKHNAEHNE